MAEEAKCCQRTILNWMEKYNIARRSQVEIKNEGRVPLYINKEWLTVQYEVEGRNIIDIAEECECDPTTIANWLPKHGIKARTPPTKLFGEDHPNWKGGRTPFFIKVRSLPENLKWKRYVYERDEGKCVMCGNEENIQIDHIIPFVYIMRENEITTLEEAKACEDLWEVGNGRALCLPCHLDTPTFGGRAANYTPEEEE